MWSTVTATGRRMEIALPCLWVVTQYVEEGVYVGSKLPCSKNIRKVGDITFPSVRREKKTLSYVQAKSHTKLYICLCEWGQCCGLDGNWLIGHTIKDQNILLTNEERAKTDYTTPCS